MARRTDTSATEELAAFREAQGETETVTSVPALGLMGEALREAFEGELLALRDRIQEAVRQKYNPKDDGPWPHVEALFPTFVIVEAGGKFYRHGYTDGGAGVVLADGIEVRQAFVPASGEAVAPGVMFMEAEATGMPGRFRVRVIKAGLSGNNTIYPDAVLREAVPLFNGARVFVKPDDVHLAGKGKSVGNLVGRIVDPVFIEGKGADQGEIHAVLEMIEPEGAVTVMIREALNRGMADLFGLSIDAAGVAVRRNKGKVTLREARSITKVNSVDLIVEPGAGGAVVELIEAKASQPETKIMERDELIALLEAQGLLKGKDADKLGDDELKAIFAEALSGKKDPADPKGGGQGAETTAMREATGDNAPVTVGQLRMIEARATARDAINASKLPDAAKARLVADFNGRAEFREADVSAAITAEADYLAKFTESGTVRGLGDGRIEIGETRFEKTEQMLEAFFDPAHKDHRHARSFKECYIAMTGDKRVTGMTRDCDQALMREALGTDTLSNVLGDSMTRRMIALYRQPDVYDVWRNIVTVVPIADFRTQERTRFGGFGDMPIVAEKAPYVELDDPNDDVATYAIKKRGGTVSLSLEMVKNDDVGVIRFIPINMTRASKRTLSKFVFDFLRTNAAIYDDVALFHADHNNLFTGALSDSEFAKHRLAMKKQEELGEHDTLGIGPRFLLVPDELEGTAFDMFRRDTNNDESFIQTLKPKVLPVWCWTDANDWCTAADPMDIPGLEIGFLDGQEEPEMFVQDSPTGGSMFSNDMLTYKLRHPYGGGVTDYRGFTKAVVP